MKAVDIWVRGRRVQCRNRGESEGWTKWHRSLLPVADRPLQVDMCEYVCLGVSAENLGSPYSKQYPLPSLPRGRELPSRESVQSVPSRERMSTPERRSHAHKPQAMPESCTHFAPSRIRL